MAFRWTQGGGIVGLGTLGPDFDSNAYGVSGDGTTVVGWRHSDNVDFSEEAFRWTAGDGMVGLDTLPGTGNELDSGSIAWGISGDGTTVVGRSASSFGDQAFRWTEAEGMVGLGDLLPGSSSISSAHAVSSDGTTIVGSSRSIFGNFEAFRWTEGGGMVGLGDLPGGDFNSVALGVSGDGTTVVGKGRSASSFEAFIWDEAHGSLMYLRRAASICQVGH